MESMDMRVVFMGSPDFAVPTLQALHANFHVVGVVTQPDRPAGRGQQLHPPDIKVLAQSFDLPITQPTSLKDESALQQLREWSPDVIVVAAYGQILRENVLGMPPFGCVNVHASLLPRWRGAAPVQAAILHDDETGVTIMKMDRGLDTGPILAQKSMLIPETMAAGELFGILAEMGASLLVDTLPKYVEGEILPQPQDDDLATYAPRLEKKDGEMDFSQPAAFLARMVRAYYPWPGAYYSYAGARIKILKAHADVSQHATPGARTSVDEQPAWGTAEGLLVLDEVQVAGKTRVSGRAFLRGARNWISAEE